MRITKIENQKRRPGRKNIFVDGEFLAGVSAETLVRLALRAGDEIGPEQIRALQQTEELLGARNRALRFLATRPRTTREVRDKLREREFGDLEIDRVIADLTAAGLLDDRAFARMYIRNTLTVRPAGHLLIKRKLLLLGIDKQMAEDILEEVLQTEPEEDAALNVARKFIQNSHLRRPNEDAQHVRHRLTGFLSRRGYSWDIIGQVIKILAKGELHE